MPPSPDQAPRRPPVVEVVDDAVADILRRKTTIEKIELIAGGWPLLRSMLDCQIRTKNPDWPAEQVRLEISRRMANGTT